jgi:hypothetical protein
MPDWAFEAVVCNATATATAKAKVQLRLFIFILIARATIGTTRYSAGIWHVGFHFESEEGHSATEKECPDLQFGLGL